MFSAEQILCFLGVFVTTVLIMKWMKTKETSTHRYPPSLLSLPFVGSLELLFIKDSIDAAVFYMKKAKKLGPIFTLRFGNKLAVTLNSKDAIEKAYIKNASVFSDRPEIFLENLVNPGNKGINLKRKATDWKKPQQLSLSVLKEFGFGSKSIMETRISTEIEAMTDYIRDKKGETFDPKDMCTFTTSNVIMNILFGRRRDYILGVNELSIKLHDFIQSYTFVYDFLPFVRFLPSYRQHMKAMVDKSKTIFETIGADIIQSLQNTAEPCFIQSYIHKAGPDYDRDQLNYTMRDLFSAGTDTSATTLQWALLILANNPDVQNRLHDEVDAVITEDRLPTLQDEARLPYVEATILEITRWRTLTPLSPPRATSQDSIVDGYFIPAGTMVMANLHAVHNDADVWKDPEVFRPERFLDNENNVIGKDKVIPFSIGRRSCLGETLARAELFLIFTSLVKRFVVLPPEGKDKVNEDPQFPVTVILFPSPFQIRLMKRKR